MCQKKNGLLFTTEAGYIAGSKNAKEMIWLKYLLSDMTNPEIPCLLVAKASAVKLSKNIEYHKRSKHIDI